MLTLQTAREQGTVIDETAASQVGAKGFLATPDLTSIDHAVQDLMIIDPALGDGWALVAAPAVGVRPNMVTAVYARRLATWQRPDGYWPTADDRPPQSYSLFTATAIALRAMHWYMPARLSKETTERSERAKLWLPSTEPRSAEDSRFRLFGVCWAGGTSAECSKAA
ncbi:MAG: hypothetical protein WAO35_09500 [Terriglobia bacterium]